MRDAVKIIHRAVERIDDPLEVARLVAADAFLAVDRVVGETREGHLRDEVLRADIEFELDVVRGEFVDAALDEKVFFQQRARGARGGDGGIQVRETSSRKV